MKHTTSDWFSLLYILLSCGENTAYAAKQDVMFSQNYTGVVFTPYTKFQNDKTDYTMEEVETLLEIVSTRFQKVSTYDMGPKRGVTTLEQEVILGSGLVPVAAAKVNKKLDRLALTVQIGVHQDEGEPLQLKKAYEASTKGNKLFPGTITGIIMTSHFTFTDLQLDDVYKLVSANVNGTHENNLKIGIRTSNCDSLIQQAQEGKKVLLTLFHSLDFIICHQLPGLNPKDNVTTPKSAADVIASSFFKWRNAFEAINHRLEVSGETGWPSAEVGKNGIPGSVESMKEYWFQINKENERNSLRVDMFTAFDEPWKVEMGPGEPHFGWWKRIQNESNLVDAFVEKFNYVEPKEESWLTVFIVLAVAIVFGILVASIFFLTYRLKIIQHELLSAAEVKEFRQGRAEGYTPEPGSGEYAVQLPYNMSYEVDKSMFDIDKKRILGSGNFGVVYQGKLTGYDKDVAFKVTSPSCSSTSLKSLLSEIKIMIHVGRHENVVSIIKAYTAEIEKGDNLLYFPGFVVIATELCENGSLENHLRVCKPTLSKNRIPIPNENNYVQYFYSGVTIANSNVESLKIADLVRWSFEIASGMDYIESKGVIHADLATRNVLLTAEKTAKITDFGLSRRLYQYANYIKSNQEPLPWKWLAIESMQNLVFSSKSDVWAFGVTLWEIFSLGDVPYPGLSWSLDFAKELERGLRMNKPEKADLEVYGLMLQCWDIDPIKRPSFLALKEYFGSLQVEVDPDT